MRTRFVGRDLVVDLLHTQADVMKVVRLSLAAGLWEDLTILRAREEGYGGPQIVVRMPNEPAHATEHTSALACFVATLNGGTPDKMIEQWRKRDGSFDNAVTDLKAEEPGAA